MMDLGRGMRDTGRDRRNKRCGSYNIRVVRYYNILNVKYVDFILGFQKNYIFQWTLAVNFKKAS